MADFLRCQPQPRAVPTKSDDFLHGNEKVLQNLLLTERLHLPDPNYFSETQPNLKPYMRDIVTKWMHEVCVDRKCDPDVFPLSVSYMDRFLSHVTIHRQQFQTLACACLFLASKFRQTDPISATDLCFFTDHSTTLSDLMSWEILVLGRLEWNMASVTAHDFIPHFENILSSQKVSHVLLKRVRHLAQGYIALVAQDCNLMALAPSVVAAASICSALARCLGTFEPQLLPFALFASKLGLDFNSFLAQAESVELFLQSVLHPPKSLLSSIIPQDSVLLQSTSNDCVTKGHTWQNHSVRGPA